jgi:hypothetical protein
LFNITYGTPNSGVLGDYYRDVLGTGGVGVNVFLGVVTDANEGAPPGGIMGIGFSENVASLYQSGIQYEGYVDTLYRQDVIGSRAYSVFFNEAGKLAQFLPSQHCSRVSVLTGLPTPTKNQATRTKASSSSAATTAPSGSTRSCHSLSFIHHPEARPN